MSHSDKRRRLSSLAPSVPPKNVLPDASQVLRYGKYESSVPLPLWIQRGEFSYSTRVMFGYFVLGQTWQGYNERLALPTSLAAFKIPHAFVFAWGNLQCLETEWPPRPLLRWSLRMWIMLTIGMSPKRVASFHPPWAVLEAFQSFALAEHTSVRPGKIREHGRTWWIVLSSLAMTAPHWISKI